MICIVGFSDLVKSARMQVYSLRNLGMGDLLNDIYSILTYA